MKDNKIDNEILDLKLIVAIFQHIEKIYLYILYFYMKILFKNKHIDLKLINSVFIPIFIPIFILIFLNIFLFSKYK